MNKHRTLVIDDEVFKVLFNALGTYVSTDYISQKERLFAIELKRRLCQGVNYE